MSTNVVLNGQITHNKFPILEKISGVGLTLICGSLFTGTNGDGSTQFFNITNLIHVYSCHLLVSNIIDLSLFNSWDNVQSVHKFCLFVIILTDCYGSTHCWSIVFRKWFGNNQFGCKKFQSNSFTLINGLDGGILQIIVWLLSKICPNVRVTFFFVLFSFLITSGSSRSLKIYV